MKSKEHKIGKEPLFTIIDGWNFGIGFSLAFAVCFVIIIPSISLVVWIILLLFGSVVGVLF